MNLRLFRYVAALYVLFGVAGWIQGFAIGKSVFFISILAWCLVEVVLYFRNRMLNGSEQIKEEQGREDIYREEYPDHFI